MKPYRFAFIACSASKLSVRARARDLYTGALFVLSLQLAEAMADRVLILSAKHGLVELDDELEPYDEKLPTEKHRRTIWGGQVAGQLLSKLGVKDRTSVDEGRTIGATCLCLAPQSYVSAIGFQYVTGGWTQPLKGLGIGHQKQFLAESLRELAAPPPAPKLSDLVLELDRTCAGDADAPFEVPPAAWAGLVEAARREGSR